MTFLNIYFKKEFQSTKWDRTRINFDLLEQILIVKEYSDEIKQPKKVLSIQSTVNPY